jgi:hypothetical protein
VGDQSVADQVRAQLESSAGSGGTFDVRAYASPATAEEAIRDREIYAALVPASSGAAELLVASAASPAVAQLLQAAAVPLGATLTDLVPAPADDPRGAGLTGGSLPMTLCGIAIGSAAALLLRRRVRHQLAAVAIASAGVGAVGVAMIHGWLGSLEGNVWAELGVLTLGIGAIATLALGVFAWFGRIGLILLDLTLVVVGNPLSGANAAPELLPLGDLGRVLPLGAAIDALRGVSGFDGAGSEEPLLWLTGWIVLGAGLALAGGSVTRADSHRTRAERAMDGAVAAG